MFDNKFMYKIYFWKLMRILKLPLQQILYFINETNYTKIFHNKRFHLILNFNEKLFYFLNEPKKEN